MPNLTNAERFIYLKDYLKGDALKLVENITVNEEGYELAFNQLDFHYLDKENVIDKTLDEILNLAEVRQLKEVESFIRLVHNMVHDLKGLNVDLLEENCSGLMLFSKIVNRKLPRHFLIELSRVTDSTYPDFNQLLNRYQSILARLNIGWNNNSGAKPKIKHKISDCPGRLIRQLCLINCCGKSEHHGALCPQSFKENPEKKMFNVQMGSDVFVPVVTLAVDREKKLLDAHFFLILEPSLV